MAAVDVTVDTHEYMSKVHDSNGQNTIVVSRKYLLVYPFRNPPLSMRTSNT